MGIPPRSLAQWAEGPSLPLRLRSIERALPRSRRRNRPAGRADSCPSERTRPSRRRPVAIDDLVASDSQKQQTQGGELPVIESGGTTPAKPVGHYARDSVRACAPARPGGAAPTVETLRSSLIGHLTKFRSVARVEADGPLLEASAKAFHGKLRPKLYKCLMKGKRLVVSSCPTSSLTGNSSVRFRLRPSVHRRASWR